MPQLPPFSLFDGHRLVVSGTSTTVALALKQGRATDSSGPLLVIDNSSGRSRDFDTRDSDAQVRARLSGDPSPPGADAAPATDAVSGGATGRGRGRPKLGVTAREVTLLPRHWEWLADQPGGASVALRRLVETASRSGADSARQRRDAERAYHFLQTIAGDLPGFEDALRALFAHDRAALAGKLRDWPADVQQHALQLAFDDAAGSADG